MMNKTILLHGVNLPYDVAKRYHDDLKRLYFIALEEKQEVFVYQGQQILTDYAKYLIQYLEMELDLIN
jgi:hypothetical protein